MSKIYNKRKFIELSLILNNILPNNISYKICDILLSKPKPKYKSGDFIVLNDNYLKYRKFCKYGMIEGMPFWKEDNKYKGEWLYCYSYGLGMTSEGYILESKVELDKWFRRNI